MAREDPQLKIRLPEALKEQIERAAQAAGRSMNAEIMTRLEGSFQPIDDTPVVIDQARQIFQLRADLALIHMGMVFPRMYIKSGEYRDEALKDINNAMDRTGPHAQWISDLPLDELNALRKRLKYEPIDAKDFKGFKTAAERDAAKEAAEADAKAELAYLAFQELLGDDIALVKDCEFDPTAGKYFNVDAPADVVEKMRAAGLLRESAESSSLGTPNIFKSTSKQLSVGGQIAFSTADGHVLVHGPDVQIEVKPLPAQKKSKSDK